MKKIFAITKEGKWGYQKPYVFQEEMTTLIRDNKQSIISSSRQMGVSTLIANYIAEMMMTHDNKSYMVISNDTMCAKKIISLIILMIENDPIPFKFNKKNTEEVSLVNGSKVKIAAAKTSAGHSYKFDHIFIDNAAFIDNLEEVYKSLVYRSGKITLSSCQRYDDSFFNKCLQNEGSWNRLKLHWTRHPEHTEGLHTGGINGYGSPWYSRMCKSLGNDPYEIKSQLDCMPIPRKKPKNTQPKDTKITIRIGESSMSKIGKKLIEKDVTVSQYIRSLIEADLQ